MFFPTSIRITFSPFSANKPPNRQPIAPAPKTATFKSLFIIKVFSKINLCIDIIYIIYRHHAK